MPRPPNQRNKLINFRVSKEEFGQIESACAAAGARNISDFCRLQVLTGKGGDSVKLDMIIALLTGAGRREEALSRQIEELRQVVLPEMTH